MESLILLDSSILVKKKDQCKSAKSVLSVSYPFQCEPALFSFDVNLEDLL